MPVDAFREPREQDVRLAFSLNLKLHYPKRSARCGIGRSPKQDGNDLGFLEGANLDPDQHF
jgi:hypothetical protein